MKQLLFAACTLLLCVNVDAQPYLDSFDINKTKVNNNPYGSNPGNFLAEGSNIYFVANSDSLAKNQLWVMYGNATQPTKLTNMQQPSVYNVNNTLCKVGNTLFFPAVDTTHGQELWFRNHDGGMDLVKDLNPGKLGSGPMNLTRYNNKLLFTAVDTNYHYFIWSYDHGTGILEKLTDDTLLYAFKELTIFNNKLCFTASTLTHGAELFEYNFTDKTTKLIANIADTNQGSSPANFVVIGSKLYFTASTTSHGSELYAYDGTSVPVRLTDLNPGSGMGVQFLGNLVEMNGKIYFSGFESNNQFHLMQYDPATSQTALAAKIHQAASSNINNLVLFRNELYFTANDGTGIDIWKYDGSAATRATNLASATYYPNINYLTPTAHALYFSARGISINAELYRYGMSKVGIENLDFNAEVSIYPNPTQDIAHLQLKLDNARALSVSVTDINGRTVFAKEATLYSAATHTIDIPMHNMPKGNYVYSIKDTDGRLMASGKLQKL